MNSYAIALAADSAVTIGTNKRVFNTANKIFMLSKYQPIGLMIYNSASFMDIPFETIVSIYRKSLKDQCFDTLHEYAEHFISFLKELTIPFQCEEKYVIRYIIDFVGYVKDLCEKESKEELYRRLDELQIIFNSFDLIEDYKDFNLSDFKNRFGQVIELMDMHIERLGMKDILDENKKEQVINIIYLQLTRAIEIGVYTGIVIAGFGEEELYPGFINYNLYGKINNRIKCNEVKKSSIDPFCQIKIDVFAQNDVAESFLNGIDSRYFNTIREYFKEHVISNLSIEGIEDKNVLDLLKQNLEYRCDVALKYVNEFSKNEFYKPIESALQLAPKEELANIAESLVSLTSLRRKLVDDEYNGTVGGPIDLAIISKKDGFIWLKRKHYFNSELNHHFFENYYHKKGGERHE